MKAIILTAFTLFLGFAAFSQQLSKEEINNLAKEQTAELTAKVKIDDRTAETIRTYNYGALFNAQYIANDPAISADPELMAKELKNNEKSRMEAIRNVIPTEQLAAFDEFVKTSKYYQATQR